MNAADIMAHPVIGIAPDATVAEAARLMLQHRISGLPVLENGMLVGIVTEGDLLRRAETGTERKRPRWLELLLGPGRLAGDYVEAHAHKVWEAMSSDIVSVAPETPLDSVVRLMEKRRIKRLPVVDGRNLVGIVSRADLLRALVHTLARESKEAAKTSPTDAAIRDSIVAEIDREAWGPRFTVDVTVSDGVVELHGTITDDRERTAVQVAAENTPGVKAVHNRLVWVEPTTGIVVPAETP